MSGFFIIGIAINVIIAIAFAFWFAGQWRRSGSARRRDRRE